MDPCYRRRMQPEVRPGRERFAFIDPQRITLDDFEAEGWILDIGGGGEGVIGQLKGDRVVAIDPQPSELREAPDGPLKIVMNATALPFLDSTFGTVTSFFTLLFIRDRDEQRAVFAEVHRVLKPGGCFYVWDVRIPRRADPARDIFALRLSVTLPDRVIETGYGQVFPAEERGLDHYLGLASQAGFTVVDQGGEGEVFRLALRKPAP